MTAPSPSPSPAALPWTLAGRAANDGGHATFDGDGRFDRAIVGGESCGSTPLWTERSPAAFDAVRDTGASTHAWLTAWLPDGNRYHGDLWNDVLEYRDARMRKLAGQRIDTAAELLIGELDAKLRARDTAKGRQFQRFECSQHTRILLPNRVGVIEATMVDVSAGGAKLECDSATKLVEGAEVSLCVESAGGPCGAVLPSRVVWTRGGALGLMFAGAPRWG